MKTLIWIIFGVYVIFARMVFKRAKSEDPPLNSPAEVFVRALVYAAFWGLFVALPGYLLYKYVIPGFLSWE